MERENPAKYLLYRPTASEMLAVLATACEALPPVSALLVYISAAGQTSKASLFGVKDCLSVMLSFAIDFRQKLFDGDTFCNAEDHVRAAGNASSSRQQIAEGSSRVTSPESSQDDADEPSGV